MGNYNFFAGKEIKLSERLLALANLVTAGNRIADIGTDHCYIPIWLCRAGKSPSAIAMDVREGPLSRAGVHIQEYGLTDQIQTRLSDGLRNLGEDEADTVLIAGMGGRLMQRILVEAVIPESVTELVLQPQSDIFLVRRWIREHGFRISDEDMVEEDGKYYPMMKAERVKRTESENGVMAEEPTENVSLNEPFSGMKDDFAGGQRLPDRDELEDLFGPVLLAKRHPVLRRWLEKELQMTDKIVSHLEDNEADGRGSCSGAEADSTDLNRRIVSRRLELTHKRELLLTALSVY